MESFCVKCSTTKRRHLNKVNLSFHDTKINLCTRLNWNFTILRNMKSSQNIVLARPQRGEKMGAGPTERKVRYGKKQFFTGWSLIKHTLPIQREREKEEERNESEGCVWHYSAAPKIAPWRPGLQLGCHGDRTTGAINRQSAPNLVRLERGQKEGETDGERK